MSEATATSAGPGLPLECDIVMAGGVTSGVVYPGAAVAIARRHPVSRHRWRLCRRACGGGRSGRRIRAPHRQERYCLQTIASQPAFSRRGDGGWSHATVSSLRRTGADVRPCRLVAPLFASSGACRRLVVAAGGGHVARAGRRRARDRRDAWRPRRRCAALASYPIGAAVASLAASRSASSHGSRRPSDILEKSGCRPGGPTIMVCVRATTRGPTTRRRRSRDGCTGWCNRSPDAGRTTRR